MKPETLGATRSRPGWGRESVRVLLALWLLSLIVNISYVLFFADAFSVVSDAASYDTHAWNLAQGKGFPTTGGWQPKREPGVFVFYGAIYYIFGHSPQAVRLVQALVASTFCVLVYLIARRIQIAGYFPPSVPIVAAALAVTYPGFVFYAGVLMRETASTFLFLASLVFLTGFVLSGSLTQAALYGLFGGLGALVDGRFFYFALFFGAAYCVVSRHGRQTIAFLATALSIALLVISPWTIRNYLVFDRFVLLATSQYKGLFLVTGPEEFLEWDWEREPLKSLRNLPAEERERELTRLAVERLRHDPWPYVKSSVRRFFRLWIGGHSNVAPFAERSIATAAQARDWGYVAIKGVFVGWNLAYVIGGFAGAILFVRRMGLKPVLHLLGFVLYLSLMHMALFATPRYQIPAIPVLTIFFAYLLTQIGAWLAAERQELFTTPAKEIV